MELDEQEAGVLMDVMLNIGGSTLHSPRKITDLIYYALKKGGVKKAIYEKIDKYSLYDN